MTRIKNAGVCSACFKNGFNWDTPTDSGCCYECGAPLNDAMTVRQALDLALELLTDGIVEHGPRTRRGRILMAADRRLAELRDTSAAILESAELFDRRRNGAVAELLTDALEPKEQPQ